MNPRTCHRCHETKPDADFYSHPTLPCRKCHRAYVALWSDLNRLKKLEYNRQWRQRNLPRMRPMSKVSQVVFKARRAGLLVPPACCSRCNAPAVVEAAHTDYSKPLDVTWLCRPCHRAWDSNQPKTLAYAEPDFESKFHRDPCIEKGASTPGAGVPPPSVEQARNDTSFMARASKGLPVHNTVQWWKHEIA